MMHAREGQSSRCRRGFREDVPAVDVAARRGRGSSWFGGIASEPETLGEDRTAFRVSERWFAGKLLAAARSFGERLLPVAWRVRLWPAAADEAILTTFGRVEIRRVPPCRMARTCVKGDAAPALETATRRLLKYLDGGNQSMARPIEQQRIAPGRWLIGVRLNGDGVSPGSARRASKVMVTRREATVLAVVRMSGRPGQEAIARADAILLATISGTEWVVAGAPMLRLGSGRWSRRSFEVAVPVTAGPRAAANE